MIHVVIVGRNCEGYVKACIDSVKASTVPFHAVVVDDDSTDSTPYKLPLLTDRRFDLILTDQRGGPAHSRWLAFQELKDIPDEDIIVLLDMDDRLQNNALCEVEKFYTQDMELTYGSCQMRTGKLLVGKYPDHRETWSYPWRCYPLRTFRMGLFRRVGFKAKHFRYVEDVEIGGKMWAKKGEWFKVCTDVALMKPLMREAKRIGHIDKLLYFYNDGLPINGRHFYPLELWHETNKQINQVHNGQRKTID